MTRFPSWNSAGVGRGGPLRYGSGMGHTTAQTPALLSLPEAFERIAGLLEQRASSGSRVILGIVGCPGAGKSTLAMRLLEHVGPERAAVAPMDGFHLAGTVLERCGLQDRKGAPETFDAEGYLSLLRRLRARDEEVVYAPEFRREIEEPVAGALPIPRETSLVITEGNYLLLSDGAWSGVHDVLDEVWFVEPEEELRLERLVARHEEFGKSPEAARAWALGSDEANARLIRASRGRADAVVRAG
ncbi:nucleoside/nucleotide kinase family protein [Arthrobacter sp. NPDC090010]|uniref:nucleoside/nucleotide kinase family protein n=1 Tax=Arthrobacter sp. NPDC090010 TaxID=3363942 RepID=UPI0037F7CDB2